jgi:hypothetical protein
VLSSSRQLIALRLPCIQLKTKTLETPGACLTFWTCHGKDLHSPERFWASVVQDTGRRSLKSPSKRERRFPGEEASN